MILLQVEKIGSYIIKRYNLSKNSVSKQRLINTVKKTVSDKEFIENIPENHHYFLYISQLKCLAAEQVVEKWASLMEESNKVNKK